MRGVKPTLSSENHYCERACGMTFAGGTQRSG